MSYLELRLKEIMQYISSCAEEGTRIDPKQKEKMKMMTLAKGKLTQGCQTGAISPQQYVEMMKGILRKDQLLAKHFSKFKSSNQVAAKNLELVMRRFKVIKGEVDEISSQI